MTEMASESHGTCPPHDTDIEIDPIWRLRWWHEITIWQLRPDWWAEHAEAAGRSDLLYNSYWFECHGARVRVALVGSAAPLSRDQVAAILKACDLTREAITTWRRSFVMRRDTALRDRAIVLVLLDAGVRAAELCDLKVGDIDLATGRVIVRKGKGGRGRIVYLGKAARRAVWRYLSQREDASASDPLFVGRNDRPLTGPSLHRLIRRLGERAGVRNLHPHRFRHSFATEFLRNGGDLLSLQRLLGHRGLEMVRRYAEITDTDLERVHRGGSPADQWRL